ncbi:flagellar motor protein MotB [Aestuariirhabdus litorea]|uniref:Type VI secretion system protein TssL n=1 Tax=Aestuariirhabdus litorea TaxID=2528527 RepID=A0A3P3VLV8_9GAMM|nr:flagellar motor protein MotB [Aestuariirhabdus litorea]RRJ83610.1 type VI secretion system protein TssL [Aestuariirhabdus litorea]RWW96831.1 type VI secretion system protein TssL [Endozoicomonadaceae bacterium GTF-13]
MADTDLEDCDCPKCPRGLPPWLATFADLMSLLMCFFVLLLSFSEINALKFKQIAGSLRDAFGVQSELKLKEIPKGTSIIMQEFSPGKPEPTPINEVRQFTTTVTQPDLDLSCTPGDETRTGQSAAVDGVKNEQTAQKVQQLIEQTESRAQQLATVLSQQVEQGSIEVETKGRKIIIRVQENGSFASGSAELEAEFYPVMENIKRVLRSVEGTIAIEGHTDSIPIDTERFESNWALSSARAVSVAHALIIGRDGIDPLRLQVRGYAETRPLESNATPEGRAKNRRVEIVLTEGLDPALKADLKELRETDTRLYDSLDLQDSELFNLRPDEVF